MTATLTQRRLAAILAADVAGYSQMMESDESGTLATLRDMWATCFNPTVEAHRGRIFKMMGDGALVEFPSVVDAVECAVAIQQAMLSHNASRQDLTALELRIGVNLGDIVIEGDDIFGDGVNVAARLEAQAPRSGVLISDSVHAQIRGKIDLAFLDAGELALKNIAAPVRAWRWGGDGSPPPTRSNAPTASDGSPSIAVLPFTNMSGDAEQEYFSDGITEDIITDLSRIAGLMVVARNSSFAYKGKTPDIRAVGRELGVSSVLEGSIRRAGNRVRITAQLIDAKTGGHLWAERYDRELTDIFAVQDEVTLEIVSALRVKLQPAERALLTGGRTGNVEAHDHFLRGRELLFTHTKSRESFDGTVAAFTRAIECDPKCSEAYAGLSLAYTHEFLNRWANTPDALGLAVHFAKLAVDTDPNDPFAHYVAAVAKTWTREFHEAHLACERALAINPNFALGFGTRGFIKMFLGQPLEAIPDFERAMRLDPGFRHQNLHFLGSAYLLSRQYDDAANAFRERIRLSPNTDLSRALLAATLGHLGEIDEARRIWDELKTVNPRYSFDEHFGRLPFRNPADGEIIKVGLAKAGLRA